MRTHRAHPARDRRRRGSGCCRRRGDATRPPKAPFLHTLAFLDPPYGRDLAPRALAALAAGGWLAPGALAVVEEAVSAPFALPDGFTTLDERRYGDTVVRFATLGGV